MTSANGHYHRMAASIFTFIYCCRCLSAQPPEDILQSISKHFRAYEWARGPGQACRLLNQMHLPRMALQPLLDPQTVGPCNQALGPTFLQEH